MNAHTPGPWEVEGIRVYAPALDTKIAVTMSDGSVISVRQGTVALVYGSSEGDYRASLDANMRLIAAAPDLIEAARHATMEWRLHGQLTDSCRVLEKAIAKAEVVK